MDKLALLEAVAADWNAAGMDYAVTHGLGAYPGEVGRDLDVIVERSQVERALAIAAGVLERGGWTVVRPPAIWGPRLVAASGDWLDLLEIHTVTEITWRTVRLVDRPIDRERVGPFQVDPWACVAKRIVGPLLAGHVGKLGRNRHEFRLGASELAPTRRMLPRLFGVRLGQELLAAIAAADLDAAAALIPALRRAAVARAAGRAPLRSLRLASGSALRRLRQPFAACAPTIAVVGPDGVGKSTLLEETARNRLIFTDVIVRHWRPGILPHLGTLARRSTGPAEEQASNAPRRSAGRFHWFRVLYYGGDYVLGILRDRIDASRQRLVLYDRCVLDMTVDPARFGLRQSRWSDRLLKHLPRPELIILLRDEPEAIYARKPELPPEEIERQLGEWEKLVRAGLVHAVLDVRGSPSDLARHFTALVVQAFCRKNPSFGASPR